MSGCDAVKSIMHTRGRQSGMTSADPVIHASSQGNGLALGGPSRVVPGYSSVNGCGGGLLLGGGGRTYAVSGTTEASRPTSDVDYVPVKLDALSKPGLLIVLNG